MSNVIGYTHGGAAYCLSCWGDEDENARDVGAIFDIDEYPLSSGISCDGCLGYIQEPYYDLVDGSLSWPDWSGVETCAGCDNGELPDVMDGNCPKCGTPWWHTIVEQCGECGEHIHFDEQYYLGWAGEILCYSCGEKHKTL